jgi:cytochrome b6-f complex iron-sulfur subunit
MSINACIPLHNRVYTSFNNRLHHIINALHLTGNIRSGGGVMDTSNRRRFLSICLGGIATAATAAASYSVFRYLSPLVHKEATGTVTIPENEIPEGVAKFFPFAGSSAVLIRRRGGELSAFSAVCTHLGCIVQWQHVKQEFLCPCHAGRFSAEGTVIAGPPPKPLTRLPVAVVNGIITIG